MLEAPLPLWILYARMFNCRLVLLERNFSPTAVMHVFIHCNHKDFCERPWRFNDIYS